MTQPPIACILIIYLQLKGRQQALYLLNDGIRRAVLEPASRYIYNLVCAFSVQAADDFALGITVKDRMDLIAVVQWLLSTNDWFYCALPGFRRLSQAAPYISCFFLSCSS